MNPPHILDDPEEIREKVQLPSADAPAIRRAEGDAEQRRQQAFDAVPHWDGRPLQPFSVSRETLFLQLRTAVGAPPFHLAMLDVEAWYADAVRMLWICSHKPAAWEELRAEPLRLQSVIDRWAEATLVSSRDKTNLVLLTLQIWNQSQANLHQPAADPSGKDHEPGN